MWDVLYAERQGQRLVVTAGDRFPIKGFDIVVYGRREGNYGAAERRGPAEAACDTTSRKVWGLDARGYWITTIRTRTPRRSSCWSRMAGLYIGFADLTWNKEPEMFCPINRVGSGSPTCGQCRCRERQLAGDGACARPRVVIADNPDEPRATPEVSPGLSKHRPDWKTTGR